MNKVDIIYPKWRKWYVRSSWYLSYFYNIVICVFLYHPEIVNMSVDNVDGVILHICKIFCIIDICTSPFIPCIIDCAIVKYIDSLASPFSKFFASIEDEIVMDKVNLITKKAGNQRDLALATGDSNAITAAFSGLFGAITTVADHQEKKRKREIERQRIEFLRENDYEIIYMKNTLLNLPHGSLQWYSSITSIYCTIVFILDFTYEGYILWGIYFFLLLNNVFSNQYSLYKDFFKTNEFVTHVIQLIDLSSNYAFLYEIGGINNDTINEYGLIQLIIYLSLFMISYISYNLLTYNNFMKIRAVSVEDTEKYGKRILYSNFIYSILGAIPISILTIMINNNDSDDTNNNTITILSVSSSILTFILSISDILTEKYQQKYIKNV